MTDEPEILDETAIADHAVERRGPDLMQVPRLLGNALTDLRTIAEGMAVLPKLLLTLRGIKDEVQELNDEVKQMRAAVESMGGDVRDGMEDVSRVAHPLRRLNPARRRAAGGQ
jgi:hypothetical protein